MHWPTAGCLQMVTNVLYDLHKHLHLPLQHLTTAGWLGCHAETVMANWVLPTSQPAWPGSQAFGQSNCQAVPAGPTESVVSYNVACALQKLAWRQQASHSYIYPAKQHSTTTTSIPLQLLFSVSHPSVIPQAPSQINIVPSNPIGPQGSGSANQTHPRQDLSITHEMSCLVAIYTNSFKNTKSSSHNSMSIHKNKTWPLFFLHYHYTKPWMAAMFQRWRHCAKIEKYGDDD